MILQCNRVGSHHRARHVPCQDRILVSVGANRTVLLAADGHGDARYCRSGLGARFACRAAGKVLQDPAVHPDAEVFRSIKREYDRLVQRHLQFRPMDAFEQEKLGDLPAADAYGTTLICAVLTESGVDCLQLGDGGVFLLDAAGRFMAPLSQDENCCGCMTSSLCYPEERAMRHVRVQHYPPAAAVFLFSDGYDLGVLEYPYGLAALLEQPEEIENQFLPAVQAADRGDDQSVIVWTEENLVRTGAFQEGLQELRLLWTLAQHRASWSRRLADDRYYVSWRIRKVQQLQGEARAEMAAQSRPILQAYRTLQQKVALADALRDVILGKDDAHVESAN